MSTNFTHETAFKSDLTAAAIPDKIEFDSPG